VQEPEEDEEEEVSLEETSMNQLDTSEGKLHAKCARVTPSTLLVPRTPESHRLEDRRRRREAG
jgi:hypothetical protein